MDRRFFLKNATGATLALLAGRTWAQAETRPKKILVLGGTWFLGPAFVDAALIAGHEVTLFNRGISNATLFPQLEKLRGFRSESAEEEDFTALGRRHWDAIIDVWPNNPRVVTSAFHVLRSRTRHYLYVSSVAVYSRAALEAGIADEQAPTRPWVEGSDSYGLGKAESERRLYAAADKALTIVRPGPIKGARDNGTDLLTWLRRLQSGGRHIAPGDGSDPVELVDVKDVARFLVLAIDQGLYGTYNLTGRSMSFREFLEQCKAAVRSNAELVWIPKAFLDEHQLPPDQVLNTFAGYFPFWRPVGGLPGLYRISSDKAYRAGWQTRPFNETAFDCLSDFRAQDTSALATPALVPWSDRLSRDTELAVLDAWQHRPA